MSQADEPTGWPDPEHADEPQHEADHDIATWLRSLSEEALWFEVERRLGLETAGCNPAEPDPEPDPEVEWRGKWELPEATALEAAAPVTASQVYAVVDATYVRECLLQAGLTECHSQEALDGFVVVASDVARVFYWGSSTYGASYRRLRVHGLTAARTALALYQQVLQHQGIHVRPELGSKTAHLQLRCALPRKWLPTGDPELQWAAYFDEGATHTEERAARDRRLAIDAVSRIISDLGSTGSMFAFLHPSNVLHAFPACGPETVRRLDVRSQRLLRGLLELHQTGTVSVAVDAEHQPATPLEGDA